MRWKHYVILWGIFTLLFTLATLGVEILEGNKITTTEYYGFRNIGMIFILFPIITGFLIYPITFLPVSLVLNKFLTSFTVRVFIYSLLGGVGGIWIFNRLYGFSDGYFIDGYELNLISAIIVFGILGFIYAVLEEAIKNNA